MKLKVYTGYSVRVTLTTAVGFPPVSEVKASEFVFQGLQVLSVVDDVWSVKDGIVAVSEEVPILARFNVLKDEAEGNIQPTT